MAIRIRVYPQYGMRGGLYGGLGMGGLGMGGYGMYGYGVQNQLLKSQMNSQRRMSSLQLQYERQLWAQRLQMAQLQAQMQYGYGRVGGLGVDPMLAAQMLAPSTNFFGGLGLGGLF